MTKTMVIKPFDNCPALEEEPFLELSQMIT